MKSLLSTLCVCLSLLAPAQVRERFKDSSATREVPQYSPQELARQDSLQKASRSSQQEKNPFWNKLVYGGNLGLSFGPYTFVSLSPAVGYKINDQLVAGTGFIYRYFKWNQAYDPNTGQLRSVDGYDNQIYGPKLFFQYFPIDILFLGTQFEYLNHNVFLYQVNGPPIEENRWSSVLFVEGGLKQPLGRKGYAVLGLRLNLLHDLTSPYATSWMPVIGFYF